MLIFACENLVPASPHTASGEISVCALWVDAERVSSVGIYLAKLNFEPGSRPHKPTNGFIARTKICITMCDVASLESNKEIN